MRELRGNSVDASHDFEQCRAICSQTLPEDGKRIKLGVTKTKTLRSENVKSNHRIEMESPVAKFGFGRGAAASIYLAKRWMPGHA
jgi:hypothetical protein